MSVTTLNDFKFVDGSVFEIKFVDLPTTAAKKDRFQWYLLFKDHRYDLSFIEMTSTSRKFTYDDNIVYLDFANSLLTIQFESSKSVYSLELIKT